MFEPNATLLVFVVMFLLFMSALNAMVLKPVGAVIRRRQEKIKGDIQAGSEARANAAAVVGDYETRMRETRAQAQSIINDVLSTAQKQRQAELKRISDEGNTRLQAAKQSIAAERSALIGQLVEEEKSLVTVIVHKLLGDNSSVFVDSDKARSVLLEEVS